MISRILRRPTGMRKWLRGDFDLRQREYESVDKFLAGCDRILDVGCGSGTYLARAPGKTEGIDTNPENVAHCVASGLKATMGSALEIPFPDDSFDAALCSHVMHIFVPREAVRCLSELSRVVKPGGVVVISNLADFRRFFRIGEGVRPYPPDALWSLCNSARVGSTTPVYAEPPPLRQEAIVLRREPLLTFYSRSDPVLEGRCLTLRMLQLRFGVVKFWTFDAYCVKLRNEKSRRS